MTVKYLEVVETSVTATTTGRVNDTSRYGIGITVQYDDADERQNSVVEVYWDGKWLCHHFPKLNTDTFTIVAPYATQELQLVSRYKGEVSRVFTYKLQRETEVIRREHVKAVPVG